MNPSPEPNAKYLCFAEKSPDKKLSQEEYQQQCVQEFRDRYHVEPAQLLVIFRMIWIGPIPSKDTPKKAMSAGNARHGDATMSNIQLNLFQEQS